MKRALAVTALLLMATAGSGCCCLWENIHAWEDNCFGECGSCAGNVHGCGWGWGDYGHGGGCGDPGCSSCGHSGCSSCGQADCSGCGDCYYGEWHNQVNCDHCDSHGNWVGTGYTPAPYAVPMYSSPPSAAAPASAQRSTSGERSVVVAQQPDHQHAHGSAQRLR